jgi:L-arabinokinase
MQAVAGALGIATEPRELALLCQVVENRVAGAACGVMDQMTSSCGQEGALLALLCQPAQILGQVKVPPEVEFLGLDSGERHAVSGSDYSAVRVGAFMGARILRETYGLPKGPGVGALANVTPAELAPVLPGLPEHLEGSLFLERYGGTTDTVTEVEPGRRYAVRTPTEHPIREHARVTAFRALLAEPATEATLRSLGELMYESHASYTACGLGSAGTDRLVALVRQAGPARGFYGAKITGGGSGGTVAVLARRGVDLGPLLETYASE